MNMALLNPEEKSSSDSPERVIQGMANVMIDCIYEKGTWKLADLRAANFSYDDISRYLGPACQIVEQRPRPSQR